MSSKFLGWKKFLNKKKIHQRVDLSLAENRNRDLNDEKSVYLFLFVSHRNQHQGDGAESQFLLRELILIRDSQRLDQSISWLRQKTMVCASYLAPTNNCSVLCLTSIKTRIESRQAGPPERSRKRSCQYASFWRFGWFRFDICEAWTVPAWNRFFVYLKVTFPRYMTTSARAPVITRLFMSSTLVDRSSHHSIIIYLRAGQRFDSKFDGTDCHRMLLARSKISLCSTQVRGDTHSASWNRFENNFQFNQSVLGSVLSDPKLAWLLDSPHLWTTARTDCNVIYP